MTGLASNQWTLFYGILLLLKLDVFLVIIKRRRSSQTTEKR